MSEIIRAIESEQLKKDLPKFNVGDTLRVMVKVVEGDRERLQASRASASRSCNGSIRETFTLRRVSYGIGVERTFPLHSPRLDKITVLRRGKVRRAKLYYLRNLSGKAAKIKEKNCAVKTAGRCVRRSFFLILIRAKNIEQARSKERVQGTGSLPGRGGAP